MKNILENHRIETITAHALEAFGDAAADSTAIDLWTNTQMPNRVLLIVDVSVVATGGTLDLIVRDSDDNSTFDADFITLTQIDATGLFFAVIDDPKRYLRVNSDTLVADVTYGVTMMTFEDQRLPVTQSGTTLAGVYGTGRVGKVATS